MRLAKSGCLLNVQARVVSQNLTLNLSFFGGKKTPLPTLLGSCGPHAQIISQIPIVLQQIRARRHILNPAGLQINGQEVRTAKGDVLAGRDVTGCTSD